MIFYGKTRPNRDDLHGMSCSEFKTLLKKRWYNIKRDFFNFGCVAVYRNRFYRFRWWSNEGFVVDVSCKVSDFDRWANSVEEVVQFDEFLKRLEK